MRPFLHFNSSSPAHNPDAVGDASRPGNLGPCFIFTEAVEYCFERVEITSKPEVRKAGIKFKIPED